MESCLLRWIAEYNDGSSLDNLKDDVTSEKIDRSRLVSFIILDITGNKIFQLRFKKGDKFAYRCRNILRVDGTKTKLHIIVLWRNSEEIVTFINESDLIVEVGNYVSSNATSFYDQYKYPISPVSADDIIIGQ